MKKIMPFLGAVQVQFTNSMMYISVANIVMMGLTFWSTAGVSLAADVFPWMGPKEFMGFAALGLACVMIFDRVVMYRHRQAFLNEQSYKYKNPAVADLKKLLADLALVKRHLGISDFEEIDKVEGNE